MSSNPTAATEKEKASAGPLQLLYLKEEIFLWGFEHSLATVRRDLSQLKGEKLVCNEPEALAKQGYQFNHAAGPGESLLSLAANTFSKLAEKSTNPAALVTHHSYPENAWIPSGDTGAGFMSQVNYFPPVLLNQFKLDHLPYLVSFGSGCTGLLSMLMLAAGICAASAATKPIICLTADTKPRSTTFDALREKILTSDCSSGFLVGRESRGFRLLGLSYYSSTRQVVPLVEIVKRSVQMIRELAVATAIDFSTNEVFIHYPNIFPTGWDMVTQYLKIPKERQIVSGFAERAHCLSSDSMISLAELHGGGAGRIHVVLNFGSGLHLGVCILREEGAK